jgi:hypothetical protein
MRMTPGRRKRAVAFAGEAGGFTAALCGGSGRGGTRSDGEAELCRAEQQVA